MSLRSFFNKAFNKSREQIDAEDEQKVANELGVTPIAQIKEREKVRVSGIVQAITYYPVSSRNSLSLGATLYDGSASLDILWLGRNQIIGMTVGIHLIVEGTVVMQNSKLMLINPNYRFIDK